MNRKELGELRQSLRRDLGRRETARGHVQVIVGMGTCGIAAGARQALEAFVDELGRHNLKDAVVRQTGCMGLCYAEPTVEVRAPGMPDIIYGKVDAAVAREIVRQHIVGGVLVNQHVYDRPAADLIDTAAGRRTAGGAAPAARGGR